MRNNHIYISELLKKFKICQATAKKIIKLTITYVLNERKRVRVREWRGESYREIVSQRLGEEQGRKFNLKDKNTTTRLRQIKSLVEPSN
jgi:hypothetical protein